MVCRRWILAGMLIALATVTAFPQVLLESLSYDLSVCPPGVITLVFRITNTGPAEDMFDLQTTIPAGWTTLSLAGAISLQPNVSQIVLVSLRVPAGVSAGEHEVLFQAVSRSVPSTRAEAALTVRVQPHIAVELLPPVSAKAVPGGVADYQFQVVNQGNVIAGFELAARSSWLVEITPVLVELFPGERAEITVRHRVPRSAIPGREAPVTVTVRSVLQADITDQVSVTTRVLPTPPELVETDLGLTLDTCARLSLELDTDGSHHSRLSMCGRGMAAGATVNTYLTVEDLWGGGPYSITKFQLQTRAPALTTTLGDVSQRLSNFLTLSGWGLALGLNHGTLSIAALSLTDDTDKVAQGVALSFKSEGFETGLGWVGFQDASSTNDVCAISWAIHPSAHSSIAAEYALANDAGQAAWVRGTWDTPQLMARGELSLVLPPFPDYPQTRSQVELSLSQRFRLEPFVLSGTFDHTFTWDNATQTGGIAVGKLNLGVSGRFTENSPQISLGVVFKWEQDNHTVPICDQFVRGLTGSISHNWGGLSLSLTTALKETQDRIAGTDLFLSDFSCSLGLTSGPLPVDIQFKQSLTEDLIAGTAQRSVEGSVHLQLTSEAQFSLALSFVHENSTRTFTAEMGFGHTSLSVEIKENLSPVFELRYETELPITLPWWPVKGQLEGLIFIDANANGRYDAGEQGFPSLVLSLDSTQALTNGEGHFRFPSLPQGDYYLRFLNLPQAYVSVVRTPIQVQLEAGEVQQIKVPVTEAATVGGRVAIFPNPQNGDSDGLYLEGDYNGNGNYTSSIINNENNGAQSIPGEALANIHVKITNGKETYRQFTDRNGYFQFDRQHPGNWTLRVYDGNLPAHHDLAEEVFELDLNPGERVDLVIKVFPRRRSIEILGVYSGSDLDF